MSKMVAVYAVAAMGIWLGCQAKQPAAVSAGTGSVATTGVAVSGEEVRFTTADGWQIAATYWPAVGNFRGAVILLHMLPADRHSYDDFGPKLAAVGFATLALDSRGHGESMTWGEKKVSHTTFDAQAYNASVEDVSAAKRFLVGKGVDTSRLGLVGASIGANFALRYAVRDDDVKAVVLLSPGLDYHGVKTEDAMKALAGRPALLVASDEDEYSARTVATLKSISSAATVKTFTKAGHGTDIFRAQPAFQDEVISWLAANLK